MTLGNEGDPAKIQRQLTATAATAARTSARSRSRVAARIFNEPILVVNQKAKLIELNNQYGVFNQNGQQIAAVNQVGQTTAKKVLRLLATSTSS